MTDIGSLNNGMIHALVGDRMNADREMRHMICLDLQKAGLTDYQAVILESVVRTWCLESCQEDWRVDHDETSLTVWFDGHRDVILFKMSEDFVYFEDPSTIQRFTL